MLRLGVVGAEFFDLSLGRRGGFGKIAHAVARYLNSTPALGIEATLVHAFREAPAELCHVRSLDNPMLLRPVGGSAPARWLAYRDLLRAEHFNALLTIDYASGFRGTLMVLPRTPVIVWSHDPRTRSDWEEIETLRIPGREDEHPAGILRDDRTSLGTVAALSRVLRRPLSFAVPAPFLAPKVSQTYGVRPWRVFDLPVFIDLPAAPVRKHARPRVVYLGRLDPIKRPWLFFALARSMPDVEFVCLGGAHYRGPGGWTPSQMSSNMTVTGHVDEPTKTAILASAWALVNTSIHESVPMSFLEALACETPIVSCQDAGGLVSRFGIHVGRFPATGVDAIPALRDGVMRLCEDAALRVRLGREGCHYTEETHSAEAFVRGLDRVLAVAGIRRPFSPAPARHVVPQRFDNSRRDPVP